MKKEKSTLAGLGAGILTVLGSITCCGAPIAAGVLASIGIGASQLAFLKSLQPYLIGIAVISLGIGFYRLYFKKSKASCCNTDSCCGDQASSNASGAGNRKSKIFLWIVTIITAVMLSISFNMNSEEVDVNGSNVEGKSNSCCGSEGNDKSTLPKQGCSSCSSNISESTNVKTKSRLSPSCGGMSCSSPNTELKTIFFEVRAKQPTCCLGTLLTELRKRKGIQQYKVSQDKKVIGVRYDEEQLRRADLEKMFSDAGFKIAELK
ncbi:hypothetical protein EYV94_20140 [Puteibacter caeruleilacunae]|nr:hypothetical protein EYV94_20140 [Puteibacter caeruleilacunae]